MEAIAAIATGTGMAGIGIVRVSGEGAIAVCRRLFRPRNQRWQQGDLPARRMILGHWCEPGKEGWIDEVMLVIMPAPHSYTREDVVEIHCHGGRLVAEKILAGVLAQGVRLAGPGEFTKRAFLNGRLDLAQAEAVLSIITAESEGCLAAAQRQLAGDLSRQIRSLRDSIVALQARLAVAIDYAGEDITEISDQQLVDQLSAIDRELAGWLAGSDYGRVIRDGVRMTIAGRPNVGKSSLLNRLLGEERAIVSKIAGTTRDTVAEWRYIDGMKCRFVDTAGIRAAGDEVEEIGVRRSIDAIAAADVVILVMDGSCGPTGEDMQIGRLAAGKTVLVVANKADRLAGDRQRERLLAEVDRCWPDWDKVVVSALTGQGVDQLLAKLSQVMPRVEADVAWRLTISRRHRQLLQQAGQAVSGALAAVGNVPPECLAVDLQTASEALAAITGDRVGDDVIERVFEEFCVGK
ncbi:MAG: tRNA uridine-5-carboxymethylaminomethyl(34) synthesis GTPase MnmE [Negativicutes bacterium]|nr:tRNA uridine-5-carboxymethylaminomethyl(34) synthesis GTPase MnmE [Negativicutes bacterium]